MAYSGMTCPQGITDETLSAWRDGVLSEEQSRDLRAHTRTCLACQQRMGGFDMSQRAMRAQRELDIQDQIWRRLQPRLRQQRATPTVTRWAVTLGGIIAVALVTVLVLVAVRLPGGTRPISVVPTRTATPAPTALTSATPASTNITPDQAWGATGTQTIPIGQDNFTVSDVLPDASGVVGVITPSSATTAPSVGYYVFASKTLVTLHTMPTADDYPNVMTDGHYVVWVGQMNNTGGAGAHAQEVGYVDLQANGAPTILYQSNTQAYDPRALAVDHGTLLLGKGLDHATLLAIDLATRSERTLLADYAAIDGIGFSESWPYLIYADANVAIHLLDISTGATQALPQVTIAPQGDAPFFPPKISGSTVTWSQPGAGGSLFYQLVNANQPGAVARQIFTFPGNIATFYAAANPRLITWATSTTGVAWDLTQRRAVYFPVSNKGTLFPSVLVHGHALGYVAGTSFIVRDTNTLATSSPTS